jgi:hypothetical protein
MQLKSRDVDTAMFANTKRRVTIKTCKSGFNVVSEDWKENKWEVFLIDNLKTIEEVETFIDIHL